MPVPFLAEVTFHCIVEKGFLSLGFRDIAA